MVIVLVVAAVVVALLAGAAIALVVARAVAAQLRRQAGAERDVAVQRAVETVIAMAGDKLGDQLDSGTRELELRHQAFEQRVADMTGELHRVTQLVQTLQKERAEQHGQLLTGLAEATRTSAALADTTQTLREVLASPKARGQWGERMADDVLRLAGFIEGVNYRKQTAITGGTIPDFTFFLPNDLLLHMDVKFPVDNYVRCLGAATDDERSAHRQAFLRDVRQRIKDLAGRDYIDPQSTVDELLLFIPNESVYAFIHEHDATLVDFALQQRVVLCSPFTLFAVLAVIRQAVDSFMLERTSDEILRCLGSFSDQWGRFSEALDGLGKRIDSAQSAYNELAGTRRRQLQRRLDEIDQLRARRGVEPGSSAEVRALRDVSAG